MANSFVKAEQVVRQGLGVLERDTVLANFVWRDLPGGGDFRGAKNDTITLRVPAYMNARTRVMRSTTALTLDELDETSVDVTLDTHVYKAIRVTDEEMTLDILDFGEQVQGPAMGSVVRKVDDAIANEMLYTDTEKDITINTTDPYLSLLKARRYLNESNVPFDNRFLAVGSEVEEALLASDHLSHFDQSGSSDALRNAVVGRVAGFTVVSVNGLHPQIAVAAHKTAFVLALVAPKVPDGASWGATASYRGMSLRVIRDYLPTDSNGPADRFLTDTFMGVGVVKDRGAYDARGQWVPSEDGTGTPKLIRAVKLQLGAVLSS